MNYSFFKNYWLWVVLILIIGVFFYLPLPMPGSGKPARLTIRFENGRARAFEGPVSGDMTVLQALISASRGGDFDLKYSLGKEDSVNLASIAGAANGPKEWHFYLNGNPVKAGEIGGTKIKSGDLIEARYESR